jgi:hyperosmotically inducible protein
MVSSGTLAVLMMVPVSSAQKTEKDHQDAFMPGDRDEAKVAQEVRHRLVRLPYYGVFDDLAFRVDGSTVTLLGQVTRPTLKSDAEKTLKGLEGVERVDNKIEVLPLSPMDDQIRLAEFRTIYNDPAVSTKYGFMAIPPIHIIVKNGHVTLEGVVLNQGDKDLIGIRANSVSGVFSVTNNLRLEQNKG